MGGEISIEKGEDGFVFIVLAVEQMEDVNGLALDMVDAGLYMLWEPGNRHGRYESCVICNEETGIKIVANNK